MLKSYLIKLNNIFYIFFIYENEREWRNQAAA
nr:MAG TPA: hypothetical protein [Caudoviricetes sp.]